MTLLHDMQNIVWHGHALNRFSVGIELVCREPGIAGLERTFWRSDDERKSGKTMGDLASPLTDVQSFAAVALGKWYSQELMLRGAAPFSMVIGHRQGHRSRTSDPGSRAWAMVGEPLRKWLDAPDQSLRTWGSGKPLPDAWTGLSRGVGYSP